MLSRLRSLLVATNFLELFLMPVPSNAEQRIISGLEKLGYVNHSLTSTGVRGEIDAGRQVLNGLLTNVDKALFPALRYS